MNRPVSANNMPVLSNAQKGGLFIRNAKSLLGMPVICGEEKLGRVSYVLPDDELRTVRGLYLYCGAAGSRFIEGAQLDLIGDVAVLAHGSGRRTPLNRQPLFRRALSADGARIGAITDAIINESTLGIEALELSRGYLDDLTGGRLRVKQFIVQKNGDIVVESTEGGNPP